TAAVVPKMPERVIAPAYGRSPAGLPGAAPPGFSYPMVATAAEAPGLPPMFADVSEQTSKGTVHDPSGQSPGFWQGFARQQAWSVATRLTLSWLGISKRTWKMFSSRMTLVPPLQFCVARKMISASQSHHGHHGHQGHRHRKSSSLIGGSFSTNCLRR